MAKTADVKDVAANFTKWLKEVAAGHEVVVTENDQPVARVVSPAESGFKKAQARHKGWLRKTRAQALPHPISWLGFEPMPTKGGRAPTNQFRRVSWRMNFFLIGRPQVKVVETGAEDPQLTLAWLSQFQLGRKRILDTLLAATLHGHGVRCLLTSNPDDFRVFGVFELIVP